MTGTIGTVAAPTDPMRAPHSFAHSATGEPVYRMHASNSTTPPRPPNPPQPTPTHPTYTHPHPNPQTRVGSKIFRPFSFTLGMAASAVGAWWVISEGGGFKIVDGHTAAADIFIVVLVGFVGGVCVCLLA